MKINLTIKTAKNYQNVEISATDVDLDRFYDTRDWLIREAKTAINILEPGDGTVETNVSTYQPVSNPKGAMASQKQVNFLHSLGYTGDCSTLSVSEANELIKQLKTKR